MDKILPQLYRDYGQYSNWRSMPSDLDGLKPVERRVLYSAFKIARDKLVKSRQVDSYTTGHYHPHGSTYGTIVQLVNQGFLEGQGNFGTSVGVEVVGAAADRYTECKISESSLNLIFKYIKNVPFIDTELGDIEPFFLPAMFPICLMGKIPTQGIGFGYKTYIPCYNIKDLFKRLSWHLGVRKTKPTISPITDCEITSTPSDLEELLTTGKAKIKVKGIIEENVRSNSVTLRSWPPGKRFESLLNKFSKEMETGSIGYTDLSVDRTEIVFKVLRERNRDKIFQDFIEKLREAVTGSIPFETIVIDEKQNVSLKSIDNMLMDTYKMFTQVNKVMLESEIKNTEEKIQEFQTLEKIREPLSHCIEKKFTVEQTINSIFEVYQVPKEIVKGLISKYLIQKLLTLSTDTSELDKKKKDLENSLKTIDDFVLKQYME